MPGTFTLQEATALLPRLTELLKEMGQTKRALDGMREELAQMSRVAQGNGRLQEVRRRQRVARETAERLNKLLGEVQQPGCELKGLDEGLVDFPTERDGRTVYLCWKLGEERIAYWHELDSGFAGRQPL